MYLTVRNPWGQVSSLDLTNMPVFRLELAASRLPPDQPAAPATWLSIAIRYVVAGMTTTAIVAALELKGTSGEADQIALAGLTRHDRAGNKDRIRESAKVLVNSMQQRAMEDVNLKLGNLVDIYHDVLDAMFCPRSNQLASVGALAKGELDGWQYLLTNTRFERLLTPSTAQPGMAAVGAFAAPIAMGSVAAAPGTSGLTTPAPNAGGGDMPPPPTTDSSPASMPAAPGTPARRQSREQRRGQATVAPATPPAGDEANKDDGNKG